jgi:ATP-dependent DNA helicase RecG
MAAIELRTLLRTETDRIEWKQSTKDGEEILQAVCALANDLGDSKARGYLLVGVSKEGRVLGVGAKVDQEQQNLANRLHSTKLLPTPAVDIKVLEHAGQTLLLVEVDAYPVPPVVAVNGVAYVRVGSTTCRAREADLTRLRERRPENQKAFDSRPVHGATIRDLNPSLLRAEYEASREADPSVESYPSFEGWLTSRKQLGSTRSGTWVPNAAALLLHGVNPQEFVPGARIEFVRYAGTGPEAPVAFRKTITGTAADQLDALWAQLAANVTSRELAEKGIRTELAPEYPVAALKELARNLVQHRLYEGTNAPGRVEWFDDRIEFSNPGGPFGRASEGSFGTHSDYRNPLLTTSLVASGYVQQLGRGIRLAQSELEKNGNPPLGVETDGFTRVSVRRRP